MLRHVGRALCAPGQEVAGSARGGERAAQRGGGALRLQRLVVQLHPDVQGHQRQPAHAHVHPHGRCRVRPAHRQRHPVDERHLPVA